MLFGKKSKRHVKLWFKSLANQKFLALIKVGVSAFIGVVVLTGAVVALIWEWVCMENILGFMESWDQTIAWALSLLVFVALMPIWKIRRAYFIGSGVMFFSPSFILYGIGYYSVWPWIFSFPGYISLFPESWELFVFYVLPTNVVVGLVFWGIAIWRKI